MKNTLLACCAGVALLLAGLPVAYLSWPAPVPVMASDARIGGAFALRDTQGRAVTDQSFAGQWRLVFFGFTQCPDICPSALSDAAAILHGLDTEAAELQVLFITLDPERDTPDVLADYTAAFDPRITALTGSTEQIRQAADAYNVYFRKVPTGASYTLDHTASMFLMHPDGRLAQVFAQDASADTMTRDIAGWMNAPEAGRP